MKEEREMTLVTMKRTFKSDPVWAELKRETVRATLTPKRIKALNLTFDRSTGHEITSWHGGNYKHYIEVSA